jgi:hypothetical protein
MKFTGRAYRLHRREVRQARREQHVRPKLLEGLKAADGVLEVRIAAQEILRARAQQERKRQRARRLHRGGDAVHRVVEVV